MRNHPQSVQTSMRSSGKRRRMARLLPALILPAMALSGRSADSAATAPPTATISAGDTVAIICLPDPERGFYRGTRFDWGSMIQSFRCGDKELFAVWRHPDTHPEVNGGAGPAEEFDSGLDGMTTPPGYHEAKIGESFLKIGVGWLKKENDQPYLPFFPFTVTDAGTWQVQRLNDSTIRITHTTDPTKKYACRLTRTITIGDCPPQLTITRELVNTGSAPLSSSHYCHNFIRMNGKPVGPGYELQLPFPAKFANSAPAGWRLADNQLSFTAPVAGPTGTPLTGVKPGETPNRFTIIDLTSGDQLLCEGSRPLSAFTVFADATILCPEPFITISLAPGEALKWDSSYRFLKPLNAPKDQP